MEDDERCGQAWKKKKMNDLPNSLEKLTIDLNKKCDKLMCKCSSQLAPSSSSTSYSVKKCTHFKHAHANPLMSLNKKYKKDLSCTSSSMMSNTAHANLNKKRSLLHSPKLRLKNIESTAPSPTACLTSDTRVEKIFGANSHLYPNIESFSTSNRRKSDQADVDSKYQDKCFKEARLSLPSSLASSDQPPLTPDTILHNISSISLQEPSPTCSATSPLTTNQSPCDKPMPTANATATQSCSLQARACYDDTSMSELASYFDVYCHIPKKMSHMAEMMYT